jgi:hypothetical protein
MAGQSRQPDVSQYPDHLQSPLNLACIQCNVVVGNECVWGEQWKKRLARGKVRFHASRINRLRRMRETWLEIQAQNRRAQATRAARELIRENRFAAARQAAARATPTRPARPTRPVVTAAERLARRSQRALEDAARYEEQMRIYQRQEEYRAAKALEAQSTGLSYAVLLEEARVNQEIIASYAREDAFRDRIEPCWKCQAPRRSHFSACCD